MNGYRVYRAVYYWFVERYTDGPDDRQLLACLDSKAGAIQWVKWFDSGLIES